MTAELQKKITKFLIVTVDMVILVVLLFFVAIDCYAAWDSKQTYQWAQVSCYEVYKPDSKKDKESFNRIKTINPDVFGWINIYGTGIDYPIVQGKDNLQYVNTNPLGQYSLSGSIFLDARCSNDFSDFNSILYGHHMEKNAMFGGLGLFRNEEYFNTHRYGMLFFNEEEHGLEFVSFIHCDAYDTSIFRTRITKQEEQIEYIELLKEKALNKNDTILLPDDRIVLLSTCSSVSTNGRDILVALITEEVFENTFEEKPKENNIFSMNITDIWDNLPLWGKIIVIVSPFLLTLILLFVFVKKKRYRGNMYRRRHKRR